MGKKRGANTNTAAKAPRPPPTPKTRKNPPPMRPPQPPNSLISYISTDTALGRHVLERIEEDGYCVLPSILSREECDEEYDRLWSFVETVAPGVKRSDPDSWYPDKDAAVSPPLGASGDAGDTTTTTTAASPDPPDPWPHSGWGNLPDMCQSYQGGWLFSDLREKLALRVFEPLYGTRLLHSSKEGFTFHRPTCSSLVSDPSRFSHPSIGKKRPRVAGKEQTRDNGDHFDQRAVDIGLQCIQSSTALRDQEPEKDGCFMCWPGSHRMHPRLTEAMVWRARSDWVPLTDGECDMLRTEGYTPRRVPVKAGDVILWRSDLCHCGAAPLGLVDTFRAVSYTCMLPARMTDQGKEAQEELEQDGRNLLFGSEAMLARKFLEYKNLQTGDHRPDLASMPHMQDPKSSGAGLMRPYFQDGPPQLSWRQAELYGLVPYIVVGEDCCDRNEMIAELTERERERAMQRGVRFRDGCS